MKRVPTPPAVTMTEEYRPDPGSAIAMPVLFLEGVRRA